MSNDILNELASVDLNTVQTALPILKKGVYEVLVSEVSFVPNKAQTGQVFNIKFTLVNPAEGEPDDKGNPRTINAGFPLFDRISAVRTFKEDGVTVKYDPLQNFARFKEAVTGTKEGSFMPIEQYQGKRLGVRVGVEDDAQFGRKNTIEKYIKAS